MNRISPLLPLLVSLFLSHVLAAQTPNYTANTFVPPYDGGYHFGANLGAYYFWTDQQLADIAAGNPDLNVPGAGVTSLRLSLPEGFVDYWGYDIRLDAFQHYDSLGINDNVVFVGFPAEEHRDPTMPCPGVQSEMFANLYEPIWDNGENGTPVNEQNFYAAYLWKLVQVYGPYTRYWEIWNEPDFDFVGNSSKKPGEPGNWWEYNPEPCDYAIHAPVQHYIRTLRISYEVIKSLYPQDYVATGGLGYPSFLDLILRQTDNPDQGKVSPEYPLTGGAYFDVLSFHSYPHIDNSLREWSDDVMGFVYFRHSDRCVDGMLRLKNQFNDVLRNYGYDGATYPEKHWIITESNIPRIQVDEYLGSNEAQRNYLIKSAVACQQNDIDQLHVYQLGDIETEKDARSEFHLMGLYTELDSVAKYEQRRTQAGIAYATVSHLLHGSRYDANRTAEMALPSNIRGGAFKHPTEGYTYVLWAMTDQDRSEQASADYTFPASLNIKNLHRRTWDFAERAITTVVPADAVRLTGSPIFLRDRKDEHQTDGPTLTSLSCSPNPFSGSTTVVLELPEATTSSLSLYDPLGRLVQRLFKAERLAEGQHRFTVDASGLPNGVYFLRLELEGGRTVEKKVMSVGN
ncbi:MAG: T9SS type A sorting domain-containing protein [Saprospiraceae bacterium]|nr:T9SS type A sorting domain-containing protein [Saprospiraceae bacterium]